MAQHADHYKKYQVYFFLYLAVICELLIIIVERDEAEEALLEQQRQLEMKNRKIILELLKNMPAVSAAGDNQLKVNETRFFTIRVKGLGRQDEVTTPPVVHVYKEGQEVQTLRYNSAASGMTPRPIGVVYDSAHESTAGEKLYRFNWIADQGPGQFEFWVEAGTNRIMLNPDLESDAKVKVGSLEFSREEIQSAINTDPDIKGTPIDAFIRRSESLDPAKFVVEVVPEQYEQFTVRPQMLELVTAVGAETYNKMTVQGTTPEQVVNMPVIAGGGATYGPNDQRNKKESGRNWVWVNAFNLPGKYEVKVRGYDKRGAGSLSNAPETKFNVTVKEPFLTRNRPRGAFNGEYFEMFVNVFGLEDAGKYSWKIELEGKEVEKGNGNVVKYHVPTDAIGKTMQVKAYYDGDPYRIYPDSAKKELTNSEFMFTVASPLDRIASASFDNAQEYSIGHGFQFTAYSCGLCSGINIRNIPRNEIRVIAETSDGRDLLADSPEITELKNPTSGAAMGTRVKFFLKGKVNKDGTDAVIRVRFGSFDKTYNVVLFPD